MDCSPPVSSVHGISQARILGCHFSRRSSWPRDWTHVSCIGRQILLSLNHQGSPSLLLHKDMTRSPETDTSFAQVLKPRTVKQKVLRAEGEDGVRRWDGWIASLMQWTWTWKTLGDAEGQGGLAWCSSWVCKELDMTGQLNNENKAKRRQLSWCYWWKDMTCFNTDWVTNSSF